MGVPLLQVPGIFVDFSVNAPLDRRSSDETATGYSHVAETNCPKVMGSLV